MKRIEHKRPTLFAASLKYILLSLAAIQVSCIKFVEIPLPPDQLPGDLVFSNDATAAQAVTGIYNAMITGGQLFTSGYTTFYAGMAADDLYYYTPGFRDEFVRNQISNTAESESVLQAGFWNPAYRFVYAANKVIESAAGSVSLSPAAKSTVSGEAKFIRAFCYFHLVNLFGDVPLVLSTIYQENQSLPRSGKSLVLAQIIRDLVEAEKDLEESYPVSERIRPNKWAAAALLARIYLYNGNWAAAEEQANKVIGDSRYSLETNLNTVFLANSKETIWQLQPVLPSRNTWEGFEFIPASNSATPTYLLTKELLQSFEPGDQRKQAWTRSRNFANEILYYPFKYKVKRNAVLTEYYIVLRLAEQYLIRAEARAQQNNMTGALEDINIIRNRAGLPESTTPGLPFLLAAIEQERRAELFAEWGHRWFDLKRTARADVVLRNLKPLTWQPTDTLWPIPQNQIRLNPSLHQNPGY